MKAEVGYVPLADGADVVVARVAGLSRACIVPAEVGAAPASRAQARRRAAGRVLRGLGQVARRVIGMTPQGRAAQAALGAARQALGARQGRGVPAPGGAIPMAPGGLSDAQRVALARRLLRARGLSPAQALIALREVLS